MENELFKYDNYTLIIKNGITIINEGPFENLNIKRLILSDSVTEIKPFAFYNNNIEEIIFNNNITKIGNCAFNKNKIKKLVLPNSLKEIGKQSFSNNEIEELVLSNNIKIIADVICNHTASNNSNKFLPHEKVDKILINRSDFWKEKIEVHDWNNRYEITHFNMGLPGLNTSNHDLQDIIIKFLS